MADDVKSCPDCAESVPAASKFCPYCRHGFQAAPAAVVPPPMAVPTVTPPPAPAPVFAAPPAPAYVSPPVTPMPPPVAQPPPAPMAPTPYQPPAAPYYAPSPVTPMPPPVYQSPPSTIAPSGAPMPGLGFDAPPRKSRLGLVLTVLVLLAGLGGAGAFFGLPKYFEMKKRQNESGAVAALRTLCEAQRSFRSRDADDNRAIDYWTRDISGLSTYAPDLKSSKVAEADGAAPAATALNGYLFRAMKLDEEGKPYDEENGGRNYDKFGVCAYPSPYGKTAARTFVVNEDGAVWSKDLKGLAADQWPRDPGADGWEKTQ